jgi:uncharacterized RDD family membrane protein YckC
MTWGAVSGTAVAGGPRAGFWQRFGASIVDGIIVGLVAGILEAVLKTAGYFLGVVLGIAYYVSFEGGPRGGGLGKQLMGIRVIDATTGEPIGYGRALVRYLGHIVSTIVFLLGYLSMLWDSERQCWHDKFAHDVVVPVGAYPPSR